MGRESCSGRTITMERNRLFGFQRRFSQNEQDGSGNNATVMERQPMEPNSSVMIKETPSRESPGAHAFEEGGGRTN